ncbi:hypothetical protein HDU84_009409 [Entophlyctis sp. JEL0112]|nr:hypothetical protein HDU84_009409 [Entophlyctis sp. JEL0112]
MNEHQQAAMEEQCRQQQPQHQNMQQAAEGVLRRYNPHSRRGRPQTAKAALTARAAQLREAQRAHRERKRQYQRSLEQRALDADEARARVALLEHQLQQAVRQQQLVRDALLTTSPTPLPPPSLYFIPAAIACPPLEIRTIELMLLAFPPFAAPTARGIPSRFLHAARAMTSCSNRHELRCLIAIAVKAVCTMLDCCSIVERTQLVDIISVFMKSNMDIYTYLNRMWSHQTFERDRLHKMSKITAAKQCQPVVMHSVMSIDSLASLENLDDLFTELGDLFQVRMDLVL